MKTDEKSDLNKNTAILPVALENKLYFTAKEFGTLVGVSGVTVYRWHKIGLLQMKQYTPKCKMVPRAELERFMRGEMMEVR